MYKFFFEPNPGEYIIIKKILVTQCSTQYQANHSVGHYALPGESIFIHKVEIIDTMEGILFRGEIKIGSWITLTDLCNNEKYAQLKVPQYSRNESKTQIFFFRFRGVQRNIKIVKKIIFLKIKHLFCFLFV